MPLIYSIGTISSTLMQVVSLSINDIEVEPTIIQLVIDGNSHADSSADWPEQMTLPAFQTDALVVYGRGGYKTYEVLADWDSRAGSIPQGSIDRWYFLTVGTGDLVYSRTAVDTFADMSSIWEKAKAHGYIVVAFTVPPATTITGAKETERLALNVSIRAASTEYDYLVDWANVPELQDPANIEYYYDGVHLTTPGEYELCEEIETITGLHAWKSASLESTASGYQEGFIRGIEGNGIWVDWGDGSSPDWYDYSVSNVTINHTYSSSETRVVTFTGRNLNRMTLLQCTGPEWGGDIANLSELIALRFCVIHSTSCFGDLAVFQNMSFLITLSAYNCGIGGNISSLSTITNMVNLRIHESEAHGLLSSISSLTSLDICTLFDNQGISIDNGTLPSSWSGIILKLNDCSLSSTEVDDCLIALDNSGAINGDLYIDGTNAARTTTSDTAYSNLISNGWTITVN